jgi:hypothetical protein
MLKNPFDRPASTVDAVVPERLKGASVERIRIVEHLAYLRSLAPSVERFGSYAAVLSGENSDAIGGYHLDQAFLKERGFSTYAKSRKLGNGSFAITWDTGCDVNALAEDPAKELLRYKFYLSLDLSSPDRLVAAQALIESVLHGARRERLSIQTKSESHAYDSCNLYTWHPVEVSRLLVEAVSRSPKEIWFPVEHVFQGKLPGIDPDWVGYAQEPLLNAAYRRTTGNGDSHSNRMARFGQRLDQGLMEGRPLDEALFREAAAVARVRADRPWLLAMPESAVRGA